MNIGIDARPLSKKLAGIGVYLYETIYQLNKTDSKNQYFLYSHKDLDIDFQLKNNWKIIVNHHPIGTFWLYNKLPELLKRDKIDVFWGTFHALPRKDKNIKYVLTVHDLALFKFPEVGTFYNKIIQKLILKRSCYNSDTIIAVSESTKKDIVNLLNISNSKINVIYHGGINIETTYDEDVDDRLYREKFKSTNNFFLYLGTIEPRKNVDLVVKAYEEFRNITGKKFDLIIAGGYGWKYKKTLKLIKNSKYSNNIKLTGYVSNEDKSWLFRNAEVFIYPSIYEGFGIPILEALSRGVPVITTNVSSMPEVGGEAAKYIENAKDYKYLALLMNEIIELDLLEKQKLKIKCIEQSKKFKWENCAKDLLDVINSV